MASFLKWIWGLLKEARGNATWDALKAAWQSRAVLSFVTAALAFVAGRIKELPVISLGILVVGVASVMYLLAPLLIKVRPNLYKGKNDGFCDPAETRLQPKVNLRSSA